MFDYNLLKYIKKPNFATNTIDYIISANIDIADEVEEQIQQLLQYDNYKDIYYGICNIWNHETDKGYMPKPKRIIPCVEVEISPDNWIMAVSADSTELLLLSCDYNIKWEQVSCLKGIHLEDVTPELDSKAYAELKNNKH